MLIHMLCSVSCLSSHHGISHVKDSVGNKEKALRHKQEGPCLAPAPALLQ